MSNVHSMNILPNCMILKNLLRMLLQLSKLKDTINTQMQSKGRELTEYRERYNIRLVGEGEAEGQGQSAASSRESEGEGSKGGAGVLVS